MSEITERVQEIRERHGKIFKVWADRDMTAILEALAKAEGEVASLAAKVQQLTRERDTYREVIMKWCPIVEAAQSQAECLPESVMDELYRQAPEACSDSAAPAQSFGVDGGAVDDAGGQSKPATPDQPTQISAESPPSWQPRVEQCVWNQDDVGGDDIWETTCKHNFYFDGDGGPLSHGLKWCGFCGKRLIEYRTSEVPAPPAVPEEKP